MKEQIYNDFTTKLLPQIQEGLMITKDYFEDLMGRYIKYLIITDILSIVLGVLFLIAGVIVSVQVIKKWQDWSDDYSLLELIGPLVAGLILFTSLLIISASTSNLIKTIYIPEVRIIEQLGNFNRN